MPRCGAATGFRGAWAHAVVCSSLVQREFTEGLSQAYVAVPGADQIRNVQGCRPAEKLTVPGRKPAVSAQRRRESSVTLVVKSGRPVGR